MLVFTSVSIENTTGKLNSGATPCVATMASSPGGEGNPGGVSSHAAATLCLEKLVALAMLAAESVGAATPCVDTEAADVKARAG